MTYKEGDEHRAVPRVLDALAADDDAQSAPEMNPDEYLNRQTDAASSP
jgi:hypothetical protein